MAHTTLRRVGRIAVTALAIPAIALGVGHSVAHADSCSYGNEAYCTAGDGTNYTFSPGDSTWTTGNWWGDNGTGGWYDNNGAYSSGDWGSGGSSYDTSGGSSYDTSGGSSYDTSGGSSYDTSGGSSYDGSLACPIPTSSPYPSSAFYPTSSNSPGQVCKGSAAPVLPVGTTQPRAGAPCAFACHFDTSNPAGAGNDYYGIARGTIGTTTPVTLRFDVVKAAVNTLISTMQTNDLAIKNLKAGVFTFDDNLTQIYPASGEAGDDWPTITAAIGGPPTVAHGADTGIQPYAGNNGGDTNFPTTMAVLASQLTVSGDGTTAATPRKVLFLVTDGVQDYYDVHGNRQQSAIDPSYCQTFKDMGFAIYVVYTPYYPLMNGYYLNNMTDIVEGSGAGTTTANLQACASAAGNYIAATDQTSLTAALQTFFRLATTPLAHFSR